jgi:hypothetical protein
MLLFVYFVELECVAVNYNEVRVHPLTGFLSGEGGETDRPAILRAFCALLYKESAEIRKTETFTES